MKRVVGFGGIFFKSDHPEKLGAWYRDHLGLEVDEYGARFPLDERAIDPSRDAYIVWSPFAADTSYFEPSEKPFMINFRVDDLDALLSALRSEGVDVDEKVEDTEYGKFGWIMDPEGNRVELWQPPLKKQGGMGSEGIEPPTNTV